MYEKFRKNNYSIFEILGLWGAVAWYTLGRGVFREGSKPLPFLGIFFKGAELIKMIKNDQK